MLRLRLIILSGFLALSAIGGGIGLLADINNPPLAMLAGSPFSDFTIPGVSLLLLVGGTSAAATILVIRRHRFSRLCAIAAGTAILIFELIEVSVLGSPAGVARNLQILYTVNGILILACAVGWHRQMSTVGT